MNKKIQGYVGLLLLIVGVGTASYSYGKIQAYKTAGERIREFHSTFGKKHIFNLDISDEQKIEASRDMSMFWPSGYNYDGWNHYSAYLIIGGCCALAGAAVLFDVSQKRPNQPEQDNPITRP